MKSRFGFAVLLFAFILAGAVASKIVPHIWNDLQADAVLTEMSK